MSKIELDLEESDAFDGFYRTWGIEREREFNFFYDESNNCRKFWIKSSNEEAKFNVNSNQDFVLGGVVYEGDERIEIDFQELKKELNLQENVKEIKFKNQFSKDKFLDCMNSKRLTKLLKWIDENGLYIHYLHVNNLYYALVEIIDSIITIDEIKEFELDYYSIKDTFYKMLKGKEIELQNLMFKYSFPNIKNEDICIFCDELLRLFEARYNQNLEEKFITGMIKRARNSDSLIFLQNNQDYIMQENYVEFYIEPIRVFKNSNHIFDEELEIQKVLEKYHLIRKGIEVDNFCFVNSASEILVQISDVVAGVIGKLLTYMNESNLVTIRKDIENLNKNQIINICLLKKMRLKANDKSIGFLHSVTAISEISKLNNFFDLVYAKSKI